MNYTEAEIKVREATNDEAWGPHGSLLQEISQLTLTPKVYKSEHSGFRMNYATKVKKFQTWGNRPSYNTRT